MIPEPIKELWDDGVDINADFELAPKKLALVAVHAASSWEGLPFEDVASLADDQGCDTILCALAGDAIQPVTRARLFGRTQGVSTIVLEVTQPNGGVAEEVWRNGARTPHRFYQRLVRSSDGPDRK